MILKSQNYNRTLVVYIDGEIDHHSVEEIREFVDKEFRRSNCINIAFDFENVNFMDSSGIGMMIGRYKNAGIRGGRVIACHINKELERIFQISGLHKIIKVFDYIKAGIDSLETRGE